MATAGGSDATAAAAVVARGVCAASDTWPCSPCWSPTIPATMAWSPRRATPAALVRWEAGRAARAAALASIFFSAFGGALVAR